MLRFWYIGNGKNDRIYLVQVLIDHLNQTIKDCILSEKQLSIDESMMLWHGHLVFRQYINNKCH